MGTRIITGFFDSRAEAERAAADLTSALGAPGGAAPQVRVHAPDARRDDEGGLMDWLSRIWRPEADFLPPEDRDLLGEGLRRGGAVVSAEVEEARLDAAMDVLERHGAVDLDAREADWRGGGAAPAPAATTTGDRDSNSGGTGFTGHDRDIGFATYGQDAVIAPLPHGEDRAADAPTSGALGRLEAAVGESLSEAQPSDAERRRRAQRDPARGRPRVRSYMWEAPLPSDDGRRSGVGGPGGAPSAQAPSASGPGPRRG